MKTWVKVVLIVGVGLVLSCGIGVLGVIHWFKTNRGALEATGEKTRAEALAFAGTHDAQACLDEALRRLDEDPGFMAKVGHKIFLSTCVEHAEKPPGFCDEVPRKDEFMKTISWSLARCVRRAQNQDCSQLVQGVQEGCYPRHPSSGAAP